MIIYSCSLTLTLVLLSLSASLTAKNNIFKKITKAAVKPIFPIPNLIVDGLRAQQEINRLVENFHVVEKGKLYRSAQLSARSLEHEIKKHNIKTVINLRGTHCNEGWWHAEKNVCAQQQVRHYDIAMSASSLSSRENLLKLLEIYDTAEQPILIHCQSGADRTGEAAAIWVLEKMHQTNHEAAKQLSALYGHFSSRFPEKDRLIALWRGREWLKNEYQVK